MPNLSLCAGALRLPRLDGRETGDKEADSLASSGARTSRQSLPTINGIGPKDELEGLLAVQMIGVHSLAVECLKRASLAGETTAAMDANINHATKLLRTFTTQMEALNRHRGKVGQQMVVGNVNVNDGGQAIVGPVSHDGRGKASTEDDADKVE